MHTRARLVAAAAAAPHLPRARCAARKAALMWSTNGRSERMVGWCGRPSCRTARPDRALIKLSWGGRHSAPARSSRAVGVYACVAAQQPPPPGRPAVWQVAFRNVWHRRRQRRARLRLRAAAAEQAAPGTPAHSPRTPAHPHSLDKVGGVLREMARIREDLWGEQFADGCRCRPVGRLGAKTVFACGCWCDRSSRGGRSRLGYVPARGGGGSLAGRGAAELPPLATQLLAPPSGEDLRNAGTPSSQQLLLNSPPPAQRP